MLKALWLCGAFSKVPESFIHTHIRTLKFFSYGYGGLEGVRGCSYCYKKFLLKIAPNVQIFTENLFSTTLPNLAINSLNNFCAVNFMSCSLLQRKVIFFKYMYVLHTRAWMGSFTKDIFLGIAWNIKICTKNSFL